MLEQTVIMKMLALTPATFFHFSNVTNSLDRCFGNQTNNSEGLDD